MSGTKKARVMIAMSGGVDSSVAALLAIRMGYECEGVTMKLYANTAYAECVADSLRIPHHVVDFSDEFRACVIEPFVASYEAGETPNPCALCNTYIKFGKLYDHMRALGFDMLVTGHYARIEQEHDYAYGLMRAADRGKDQSYFLYGLTQEKLGHTLFPLGGLTKKEVRAIAAEAGFINADQPESQDICFVPEGGYANFIEDYRKRPPMKGNFVDTSGRVLGQHGGVERYTIGQRKGLGIAFGRPLFVKEIRPETGEVVLADEEKIFTTYIEIADVNWLAENACPGAGSGSEGALRAEIMIRYKAKPAWATIKPVSAGHLMVEFDEPVRAPAIGQAAVMYDGDRVIGGGRILAL